jgi:hypothetical protein
MQYGPAYLTLGSAEFYFQGDCTVNEAPELSTEVGPFGVDFDARLIGSMHTISGTVLTTFGNLISALQGFANTALGTPIFNDVPLVLKDQSGAVRSYENAAITAVGAIKLTSKGLLKTTITFTCLHHSESIIGDAGSLYTPSTASWAPPGIDPANIPSESYTAALGASSPWNSFAAQEGFDLSFTIGLTPEPHERRGVGNMLLNKFGVEVSFVPDTDAITDAVIAEKMRMQEFSGGAALVLGQSVKNTDNFVLTTNGSSYLKWTLKTPVFASRNRRHGVTGRTQKEIVLRSLSPDGIAPVFSVIIDD